jgi:hypothetical protein
MFTKTKFARSAAIILGITCMTLASHAFAEDTSSSGYGVWDNEWLVQGDTWIRRDELTIGRYGNNALMLPAPSEPRLAEPKVRSFSSDQP